MRVQVQTGGRVLQADLLVPHPALGVGRLHDPVVVDVALVRVGSFAKGANFLVARDWRLVEVGVQPLARVGVHEPDLVAVLDRDAEIAPLAVPRLDRPVAVRVVGLWEARDALLPGSAAVCDLVRVEPGLGAGVLELEAAPARDVGEVGHVHHLRIGTREHRAKHEPDDRSERPETHHHLRIDPTDVF